MDGLLNTHDVRCEEELLSTVIVKEGGKRAVEWHFFVFVSLLFLHLWAKSVICSDLSLSALLPGSDIVQWMIKNLDIEDQGRVSWSDRLLYTEACCPFLWFFITFILLYIIIIIPCACMQFLCSWLYFLVFVFIPLAKGQKTALCNFKLVLLSSATFPVFSACKHNLPWPQFTWRTDCLQL